MARFFFNLKAKGPVWAKFICKAYGIPVPYLVRQKGFESTGCLFESQYKLFFLKKLYQLLEFFPEKIFILVQIFHDTPSII